MIIEISSKSAERALEGVIIVVEDLFDFVGSAARASSSAVLGSSLMIIARSFGGLLNAKNCVLSSGFASGGSFM